MTRSSIRTISEKLSNLKVLRTTLIFLFLNTSSGWAADFYPRFELGSQSSYETETSVWNRYRLYGGVQLKIDNAIPMSRGSWEANLGLRAWYDRESEIDLRTAQLTFSYSQVSMSFGLQEVAWGETFGVYISDLVCPRDLRDPFFNELDFIRRPVVTFNALWLPKPFSLQWIFTPYPDNNRYPGSVNGIRIRPPDGFSLSRASLDRESGIRLGWLFDSGWDVHLFYFWHWDRSPTFQLTRDAFGSLLVPIQNQVHSLGFSFSQSFDPFVVRGDTVIQFKGNVQDTPFSSSIPSTILRSILGSDVSYGDGWSSGLQYHLESQTLRTLHWVSGRTAKRWSKDQFGTEIYFFQGLNNSDTWVEPKADWNFADWGNLALSYTFVANRTGKPGLFALFQNRDRLFVWLKARF